LFECFSDIKSEAPFDRKKKRKTRKNKKKSQKKSFFSLSFSLLSRGASVRGVWLSAESRRQSWLGARARGARQALTERAANAETADTGFFSSSAKKTIFSTLFFFSLSTDLFRQFAASRTFVRCASLRSRRPPLRATSAASAT
jgi:hypothetical protein